MMGIGEMAHVYLERVKLYTSASLEMSDKLDSYFQGLPFAKATGKASLCNAHVSGAIRKSVAVVALEQCLGPLKEFCAVRVPAIEAEVTRRNDMRTDFDSYRRRLRTLEASKDPDRQKVDVLRQKMESARTQYEDINRKLIADFRQLKTSKEDLLQKQAAALLVCQHEFLARAAQAVAGTLEELPHGVKQKTEKSIEQLVRSGGPDSSVTVNLIANRASFCIQPADLPQAAVSPPLTGPARISARRLPASEFDASFRMSRSSRPAAQSKKMRPPPGPPPMPSRTTTERDVAVALHTFEPRDDSEIGFSAGDRVEIIERDESGWWVGTTGGKTGQFPANYVEVNS